MFHGVSKSWTQLSDFTFTFYFPALEKAGEGNGNPLQYSCLENPMDAGAWWLLEKEMATHSSVLAWIIPGQGSLVGCHLWGHTELDTTEAT